MNKHIKAALMQREGYSTHSAEVTSNDLENIKDHEILQALKHWVDDGKKTNIIRGPFSSCQLMSGCNMKYPATLVFLDWYSEDPESAVASIKYCRG